MYCINCGKEIPTGESFCQYCGVRQDASQQPVTSQIAQPQPYSQSTPQHSQPQPYSQGVQPQYDNYGAPQQQYDNLIAPPQPNYSAAPQPQKKSKKTLIIALIVGLVILIAAGVVLAIVLTREPADTDGDVYESAAVTSEENERDIIGVSPSAEPEESASKPEQAYGDILRERFSGAKTVSAKDNLLNISLASVDYDDSDILIRFEFEPVNTMVIALFTNFYDAEDYSRKVNGLECGIGGNIGVGDYAVIHVPKTAADDGMIVFFEGITEELGKEFLTAPLFYTIELGDDPRIVGGPFYAENLFDNALDTESGAPEGASGLPSDKPVISTVENVTEQIYQIETAVYSMWVLYTGEWSDDKPNGEGFAVVVEPIPMRFEVDDKLEGVWVDGLLEGPGVYTSGDGNFQLRGVFINGLKEGTVEIYQNDVYVGDIEFVLGSPA